MCALTIVLLLFPGTRLNAIWGLNPGARPAFESMGNIAILLMLMVGLACGLAAIGLAHGAKWGCRVAIVILSVNLIGDLLGAFLRRDLRTLIGVPIAGAMIFYLVNRSVTGGSKNVN